MPNKSVMIGRTVVCSGNEWSLVEDEYQKGLVLFVDDKHSIFVGLNDNGDVCDSERIKILEYIKFGYNTLRKVN